MTNEEIKKICKKFILKEISILEFQSRIRIVRILDEDFYKYSELLEEIDNRIEEIIFTEIESNFYSEGLKVIKKIYAFLEGKL